MSKKDNQSIEVPGWIEVNGFEPKRKYSLPIDDIYAVYESEKYNYTYISFKSSDEVFRFIESRIEIMEKIMRAQCSEVNVSGRVISDIPFHEMKVCPVCGNKSCPKAKNELYKCTGSNEPGQVPEIDDEAIPNSVF